MRRHRVPRGQEGILLLADLFHPVSRLAVERLIDGNVRHRRGWRGAVPMLLARRDPDHVARPDLLDRAAPALRPAAATTSGPLIATATTRRMRAAASAFGVLQPHDTDLLMFRLMSFGLQGTESCYALKNPLPRPGKECSPSR
jgi:hypothetical protein